MAEIDVTNHIVQLYAGKFAQESERTPVQAPPNLHPHAAAMFFKLAEHAVRHVDQGAKDYEDYTVPAAGLALANCLAACERAKSAVSFEVPSRPDPWAKATFFEQLMAELNREQMARLQYGVWSCHHDLQTDRAHVRLARRRRKSALTELNNIAQPELLRQLSGRELKTLSLDELYHELAANSEMLHFATQTDPAGWAKFESAVGIDAKGMAALAGFLVFLSFAASIVRHSCWYDEPFLTTLWHVYANAYPENKSIDVKSILAAIGAFAMTPLEAAEYLIHPPFFSLHGQYLRNPCFFGAHHPIVGMLIIAIRRNERVWSETLGTSLGKAADTLAAFLPSLPRLRIATRRKYSGGDVDLALYDSETRELLICEVKTVYDKHRTDSLMKHFEDSKVNVSHAISQLRSINQAIANGVLTLKHLFKIPGPTPARVHLALLTWIDPIDLTMETPDEEISTLNFATFLWLARESGGNVQTLAAAVHELRNLWTTARTRPLDLGQPELTADIEVQGGFLDSRKHLETLALSPLTRQILRQIPSVDDDLSDDRTLPRTSYFEDSRRILT